jgi:hypothetical protein
MLLKPGGGFKIPPGKNGGTLKMQQSGSDVFLSLAADCLGEGDYFLYLFTDGGREIYAGDVRGGELRTALPDVRLESIAGAAIVSRDGSGAHAFCLISRGSDWPRLIARFRAARSAKKTSASNTPHIGAGSVNPQDIKAHEAELPKIEEPETKAPDIAEIEPAYFDTDDIQKELACEIEQQNMLEEKAEPGIEETGCDECPQPHQSSIDPFPSIFPNSEWIKISYPGPTGWWHYISGSIYKGGALVAKALGVPGEYGMAPPVWLEGFGTYLRCFTGEARGYWLMFQDAETGEVLDMGLSRHGG